MLKKLMFLFAVIALSVGATSSVTLRDIPQPTCSDSCLELGPR